MCYVNSRWRRVSICNEVGGVNGGCRGGVQWGVGGWGGLASPSIKTRTHLHQALAFKNTAAATGAAFKWLIHGHFFCVQQKSLSCLPLTSLPFLPLSPSLICRSLHGSALQHDGQRGTKHRNGVCFPERNRVGLFGDPVVVRESAGTHWQRGGRGPWRGTKESFFICGHQERYELGFKHTHSGGKKGHPTSLRTITHKRPYVISVTACTAAPDTESDTQGRTFFIDPCPLRGTTCHDVDKLAVKKPPWCDHTLWYKTISFIVIGNPLIELCEYSIQFIYNYISISISISALTFFMPPHWKSSPRVITQFDMQLFP